MKKANETKNANVNTKPSLVGSIVYRSHAGKHRAKSATWRKDEVITESQIPYLDKEDLTDKAKESLSVLTESVATLEARLEKGRKPRKRDMEGLATISDAIQYASGTVELSDDEAKDLVREVKRVSGAEASASVENLAILTGVIIDEDCTAQDDNNVPEPGTDGGNTVVDEVQEVEPEPEVDGGDTVTDEVQEVTEVEPAATVVVANKNLAETICEIGKKFKESNTAEAAFNSVMTTTSLTHTVSEGKVTFATTGGRDVEVTYDPQTREISLSYLESRGNGNPAKDVCKAADIPYNESGKIPFEGTTRILFIVEIQEVERIPGKKTKKKKAPDKVTKKVTLSVHYEADKEV